VLEVVGGALVLSGRLVPLGLVVLTPVAVNIALFDILLVGQPALGVILTGLCFFLVWAYRSHFAGVFAVKPQIG
jgi:putative oxidoreductase